MPSRSLRDRLGDIREHIELANDFVAGMTYEQFEADTKTILATTRCLEIISEASRHLNAATKSRHPEIEWADIAGAGNIFRHDYPVVRTDLVWKTVKGRLPQLLAAVEAELAQASSP